MASIPSSCRPCKQLRELLQEQQEPILLDACLYENVYPRKVTYKDNCSCGCWSSYHHSRKRAACKNGKIFFANCSRFLRALSWTIGIERSQEAWDINGEGYGNREVDRSSCISEMGGGSILLRGRMSISSSCFDGEELDSSFLGLQHYNAFVFTDDDGAARQYNSFTTQTSLNTIFGGQSKCMGEWKQSSDPVLKLQLPPEDVSPINKHDKRKRMLRQSEQVLLDYVMKALENRMKKSGSNGKWCSQPVDTKLVFDEVQAVWERQGGDHVTNLTQYLERDLSINSQFYWGLRSEQQRLNDIGAKVADAIFESLCHGLICEMLDSRGKEPMM